MSLGIAVLLIVLLRVYLDVKRDPHKLPIVIRFTWALIVVLLLTAALRADDATTDVLVRCQKWWIFTIC